MCEKNGVECKPDGSLNMWEVVYCSDGTRAMVADNERKLNRTEFITRN